jgi:acyl-CoA dehydrogenase
MHFAFDETTTELIAKLEAFMDEAVYPAEAEAAEQIEALYAEDRWDPPAVLDGLKEQARERGLWNFFLAGHPEEGGLTNLQYAPLAEITWRC